jgi:alpha-glucosidase
MSAETQEANPDSMLAFSRRMIALRKASLALTRGATSLIETPEPVLAFTRTEGEETVLCVFNMSEGSVSFSDPRLPAAHLLEPSTGDATLSGETLSLGPATAALFRL